MSNLTVTVRLTTGEEVTIHKSAFDAIVTLRADEDMAIAVIRAMEVSSSLKVRTTAALALGNLYFEMIRIDNKDLSTFFSYEEYLTVRNWVRESMYGSDSKTWAIKRIYEATGFNFAKSCFVYHSFETICPF